MTNWKKLVALSLVLTLVVFAAAACGVPDEEDFETEDDLGYYLELEEDFAAVDYDAASVSTANILL